MTRPVTPHDLAVHVLEAMAQDSGPVDAEPYAGWAKTLAAAYLQLEDSE